MNDVDKKKDDVRANQIMVAYLIGVFGLVLGAFGVVGLIYMAAMSVHHAYGPVPLLCFSVVAGAGLVSVVGHMGVKSEKDAA